MERFRKLSGLPPYGDRVIAFPATWGLLGREGVVVEFIAEDGATWVGNFKHDINGTVDIRSHPNKRDALIIAGETLWHVKISERIAEEICSVVDAYWLVNDGIIFSHSGLAFVRIGPEGMIWRTRRVSWDGFKEIQINQDGLTGHAWSRIEDGWISFRLDLNTGRVEGGSYNGPEMKGWEHLAD